MTDSQARDIAEGAECIARSIDGNFTSPNVSDRNLEAANVVDVIAYVAAAGEKIAVAINNLADAVRGTVK